MDVASALITAFARDKVAEKVFLVAFSALLLVFFYVLISANGLVLGNDSAVHLTTAIEFLGTGRISLGDIAWYPPLFHIMLATFMTFTGVTSVDQMLFLMKTVTALVDWLLVFSVYLLGAKFFGKKVGVLAAVLLLLCFPLYEINFFGSYTSILAIAFMSLLFVYISLERQGFEDAFLVFILAFSVVLSHQLGTFMAFMILFPFIIFMLIKSKGRYSKVWIGGLLGGLIAFLIYYSQAILPYIGSLVSIVFFQLKAMTYQVSGVSTHEFLVDFGVVLFFAFSGIVVAFFRLREKRNLSFYLLLILAFSVPLFFSQSYNFGLLLPYEWFLYYLLPPLAVLAGVFFSFTLDVVFVSFFNKRTGWKKLFLRIISVAVVVVLLISFLYSFQTVTGKINEGTQFYSWSDMNAYNVASWLRNNYPDMTMVVASMKPGSWFGLYSGKYTIAETDPVVQWNDVAESVLDLSHEIANPVTMVRIYQSLDNVSEANYVSVNGVWQRISYISEDYSYVSFREGNGTLQTYPLSFLNKEISLDNSTYPQKLSTKYSNSEFALTEDILVQNDSYPITFTWTLSALKNDLDYITLYISTFFDPSFSFGTAYIPNVLNWQSPWDNPSKVSDGWAITDFSGANFTNRNLTNSTIGVCDNTNNAEVALNFVDKPETGNIGALGNRLIDALRFQYDFYQFGANQTFSSTYQMMAFSQTSFNKKLPPDDLTSMFNTKFTSAFDVECSDYADYVNKYQIAFIVYSTQRFDSTLLRSGVLQVVYTNDEFILCKIKNIP